MASSSARSPGPFVAGSHTTALALLLAAGCAIPPPPPLVLPPVAVATEVFAGSVMSGPYGAAPEPDMGSAQIVEFALYYSVRVPFDMESLATHSRVVLDAGEEAALRPASRLAAGARVAQGDAAVAVAERLANAEIHEALAMGESSVVLGVGATGAITGHRTDLVADPAAPEPRRKSIAVMVSHPDGDTYQMGLVIEANEPRAFDPDRDFGGATVAESDLQHLTRELLLLDLAPQLDGPPIVTAFPSPFRDDDGAFAAVVRVRSPRDRDELDEALRATAETIAATRSQTEDAARTPSAASLALERFRTALGTLDAVGYEREAVADLAESGDAPLAQDLVTVAGRQLLMAWIDRIQAAGGTPEAWTEAPADDYSAWLVERAAWSELAHRLDSDTLDPPMRGLLARHAGEAGRFPGVLSDLLAATTGAEAFRDALYRENLGFLGASDPSARLRALDWLAARDLAPANFDPFADRDTRREVLRAHEAALWEAHQQAADATSANGAQADGAKANGAEKRSDR